MNNQRHCYCFQEKMGGIKSREINVLVDFLQPPNSCLIVSVHSFNDMSTVATVSPSMISFLIPCQPKSHWLDAYECMLDVFSLRTLQHAEDQVNFVAAFGIAWNHHGSFHPKWKGPWKRLETVCVPVLNCLLQDNWTLVL